MSFNPKSKIIHLHGSNNLGGVALYCSQLSENNVKVSWSICSPSSNYNRRHGRGRAASRHNGSNFIVIEVDEFSVTSIVNQLLVVLNNTPNHKHTFKLMIKSISESISLIEPLDSHGYRVLRLIEEYL